MQTPVSASHSSKRSRNIVIVVAVIVIIAGAGYYLFNLSLTPNIQETNLSVGTPSTNPQTNTVQNQGRVAVSGSFSYTPNVNGVVYLAFDNSFSFFSSKSVSVSYTVGGATQTQSFDVSAGNIQTLQISLNAGQSISGTFSISGGSGNDIDFYIQQYTCSQSVPFSLTLVNSGKASGYVVLSMTSNGASVYSNRYFVAQGQQLPVSGDASMNACPATTTLTPVLSQQQKG